jgi:hypothetical protein
LEAAGIGQQVAEQGGGGRRREGLAREAHLHEAGEVAGVVDVGVGEDHAVDRLLGERKRLPVALVELEATLEETAVHEDPEAVEIHEVA